MGEEKKIAKALKAQNAETVIKQKCGAATVTKASSDFWYMDPDKAGKSCAGAACSIAIDSTTLPDGDAATGDVKTCASKKMKCSEWTTLTTAVAASPSPAGKYISKGSATALCKTKQCTVKDDAATCLKESCGAVSDAQCKTQTNFKKLMANPSETACAAATCDV